MADVVEEVPEEVRSVLYDTLTKVEVKYLLCAPEGEKPELLRALTATDCAASRTISAFIMVIEGASPEEPTKLVRFVLQYAMPKLVALIGNEDVQQGNLCMVLAHVMAKASPEEGTEVMVETVVVAFGA